MIRKKKFSAYIFTPEIILVICGLVLLPLLNPQPLWSLFSAMISSPRVNAADVFSPPLGYRDGLSYGPRVTYNNEGKLIEDTDYGVQNPDLQGGTCFGIEFSQLYHAGADWYRQDGNSTTGAEVTAVAAGIVRYADPNMNYPGLVVIIEHLLTSGDKIYSVYAHLADDSLEVEAGQAVARGQRLGEVMYLDYTGRYPEYHPSGDDSHLHYEIRYFYNGRDIYPNHPACNGIIPGRGYTYPETPDKFPSLHANYADPAVFVQNRLSSR